MDDPFFDATLGEFSCPVLNVEDDGIEKQQPLEMKKILVFQIQVGLRS
jgi:hypothetical protein